MSRINGEKARAAIARKRRTASRVKDRALRVQLLEARKELAAHPVAPAPRKPRKKKEKVAAPPVEKVAKAAAGGAEKPKSKPRKKVAASGDESAT